MFMSKVQIFMWEIRITEILPSCISLIYVFLGKRSIFTKEDWTGMREVVVANMSETTVNRYG